MPKESEVFKLALLAAILARDGEDPSSKLDAAESLVFAARRRIEKSDDVWSMTDLDELVKPMGPAGPGQKKPRTRSGYTTAKGFLNAIARTYQRLSPHDPDGDARGDLAFILEILGRRPMWLRDSELQRIKALIWLVETKGFAEPVRELPDWCKRFLVPSGKKKTSGSRKATGKIRKG